MDIVIAGLGNPGPKYAKTFHNAGFMVCERLAEKLQVKWKEDSHFQACIAKASVDKAVFHLLCPMTFMNLSGEAVALYLKEKKIAVSQLIVVADDADLKFGELRMRPFGGSGGQNGLKSVAEELNTTDFKRLRVGIGRPVDFGLPVEMPLADYVLLQPSETVLKQLYAAATSAADALFDLSCKNFEAVMMHVNATEQ